MYFTTNYHEILQLIENIDPIKYGKTRNYLNGAVTKLSPYISRGVISTKQVATAILNKGYKPYEIESFLKELAWRDYFQQVWIAKQHEIDSDLKQQQPDVNNHKISTAIISANTGIEAIDAAIQQLYSFGYMHNHMRMYVASNCCNIAKSHWFNPSKWMYYYLLDADWASNALSWQWVAGSFSNKKYYANQENINKYCGTNQVDTYLDVSYERIEKIDIPTELKDLSNPFLKTTLPEKKPFVINENLPAVVYNFYNLDPIWLKELPCNRIFIVEPSFYKKYPVSDNTINFILNLSKNISNIQVFVGEFDELASIIGANDIHYKEHPTATHYKGILHKRDWMFEDVTGYFPSFFSYWKKCERNISKLIID
ncbi:MAG: FAD-binding domain-containing protein [Chitinophagaceae bacterium]